MVGQRSLGMGSSMHAGCAVAPTRAQITPPPTLIGIKRYINVERGVREGEWGRVKVGEVQAAVNCVDCCQEH